MPPPDKPVHANNVPTPTSGDQVSNPYSPDQISERAKKLWQDRQQPSGQDESIWLEAEAQLKAEAESRPVAGTESRPYTDEPGQPLKSRTKVADPADAAAQPRSATESKAKPKGPKLRNQ